MKKKVIGIIVGVVVILFGLGMCSGDTDTTNANTGNDTVAAEEAVQEDAPTYDVKIGKATQTTDYEGKPVLVVEYTWTNNSDSKSSIGGLYELDAYQNGVELTESWFVDSTEEWNFDAIYNEIKPGATQTVHVAYELDDQSEVTIEVYDWLFEDVAATKTATL